MGIHAEHSKLGHRLIGKKILPLLAGSFLLLTTASAADAAMILRLEEVGGDVVVRGSGSINLDGLTLDKLNVHFDNIFTPIQLYAGPVDGQVDQWSAIGLTGPAAIGTVEEFGEPATDGTGQLFGIISADTSPGGTGRPLLVLPTGYVSGAALSGTTRFAEQTFASMGISGTLTWTLPSADTVTITTDADPVPAPLGVASAAAVFSAIRRLKHNTRILQLASRKRAASTTSIH
jgi:hypothetical protein